MRVGEAIALRLRALGIARKGGKVIDWSTSSVGIFTLIGVLRSAGRFSVWDPEVFILTMKVKVTLRHSARTYIVTSRWGIADPRIRGIIRLNKLSEPLIG